MLDALSDPDAVAAADELLESEVAEKRALSLALERCEAARHQLTGEARKAWSRAIRHLAKGRRPNLPHETPPLTAAIGDWCASCGATTEARVALDRAMNAAQERIGRFLRHIGRHRLFRLALIWQNRRALSTGVDRLLEAPVDRRDRKVHEHEQLVVRYLQRYCAKNDSIGFFGPFGWARIEDDEPSLTCEPGPDLVVDRQLHFEYWAVEELARVVGADPRIRPWLAPRLDPRFRIHGDAVVDWHGRRTRIGGAAAPLVAACDGQISAREIAASAIDDPSSAFNLPQEVYSALDGLADKGVIVWKLEVPIAPQPQRALRQTLMRIGDDRAREESVARLDLIDSARDAVADGRDDESRLDAAFEKLEMQFNQVTGQSATRHDGACYAGRTLVYEDCRRDATVRLGPSLIESIAPPLMLLLHSARWFTYEIARRTLRHMDAIFDHVRTADSVDFGTFWNGFFSTRGQVMGIIQHVGAELQSKWAAILTQPGDTTRIDLRSESIHDRVVEAFAAPCPGWPQARYHAPDLMIAADSAQAVCEGRWFAVCGETHAGVNSLMQAASLQTYPLPDDLMSAQWRDVNLPQIFPVCHRRHLRAQRSAADSVAAEDLHLGCNDAPSWRPDGQILAGAQLVIERAADGLRVRTRDGQRCFHIMNLFEHHLRSWSATNFHPVADAVHTPRITVDRLVIARESWRMPCGEPDFARKKDRTEQFVAARRWARTHGMPQWVFAHLPRERKPVYVDLHSPPSVDLLAKFLRAAAAGDGEPHLRVCEMLPTPRQAWLTDAESRRYLSELRIAAVDPQTWRPMG